MRLRPTCAYPKLSRWLTRDTALLSLTIATQQHIIETEQCSSVQWSANAPIPLVMIPRFMNHTTGSDRTEDYITRSSLWASSARSSK